MKIYVGYVLNDYACAVCMGLDETKVRKVLNSYEVDSKYIEEYELKGNTVVELDCE